MQWQSVESDIYISGQLQESDMENIQKTGFKTVICQRPNQEESGQPDIELLSKPLQEHGVEKVIYQPLNAENLNLNEAQKLAEILENAPRPVLIYCRTGYRSSILWQMMKTLS